MATKTKTEEGKPKTGGIHAPVQPS
ncbi:MAG: hypothetical protein K0Q69_2840, partial [Devosia sp.]|nr:hypothetical protein [Devosia sp.]